MKKYSNLVFLVICIFLFVIFGYTLFSNKKQNVNNLLPNKIYFFYQNTCQHCHDALQHINSLQKDLPIIAINIADNSGYQLFVKCAKKFNLGNNIGTPLFCIGDKYIMGWSNENAKLFDEYTKNF